MLSVYKNLRIFVPDVLKFFNDVLGDSFQSRDLILNFIIIFKFFYFLIFLFICLFIWLCQVWSSIFIAGYGSCIMWDPVPRPGPPALWAWSLNCWTTREVPNFIISLILYSLSFAHWGNYLFSLTVPLSHHPPPCPLLLCLFVILSRRFTHIIWQCELFDFSFLMVPIGPLLLHPVLVLWILVSLLFL